MENEDLKKELPKFIKIRNWVINVNCITSFNEKHIYLSEIVGGGDNKSSYSARIEINANIYNKLNEIINPLNLN